MTAIDTTIMNCNVTVNADLSKGDIVYAFKGEGAETLSRLITAQNAPVADIGGGSYTVKRSDLDNVANDHKTGKVNYVILVIRDGFVGATEKSRGK